MTENSRYLQRSTTEQLAALMAYARRQAAWRAEDLADILRHQLSTPVVLDLRELASATDETLHLVDRPQGVMLGTFDDLLHEPRTPPDLLRLAKDFAKSADARLDDPLPPEIATALYYAVIAAALVHHGQRITDLGGQPLHRGMGWVLARPWVDERTKSLLQKALCVLGRY